MFNFTRERTGASFPSSSLSASSRSSSSVPTPIVTPSPRSLPPRAAALEAKGSPSGGLRAGGKGSLASARLPVTSSATRTPVSDKPLLLARIRSLTEPGAVLAEEQGRDLQALVGEWATTQGPDWIAPLFEATGGNSMPVPLRDAIIATLASRPVPELASQARAVILALSEPVPANEIAYPTDRCLPPATRPFLKALFTRVCGRTTLDSQALAARAGALHEARAGLGMASGILEDYLNALLDARIRFAALPPESDPHWLPPLAPLPEAPGERILHAVLSISMRPQSRRGLLDLVAAKLHSAARGLRPDGIWQLYTELGGMVRSSGPGSADDAQALVKAVLGLHEDLNLLQFHEAVHAVAGALARPADAGDGKSPQAVPIDVALGFYRAALDCPTPLPAPRMAAMAAALADAMLEHAGPGGRDAVTNEHLDALLAAAPDLAPAQRMAAVMGLCSAHARRNGGRTPQALKALKSALDTRRRQVEELGGPQLGVTLAADFSKGLLLALEPQRALQPDAWELPLAPQEPLDMLLVAFGMPVHGLAPAMTGGLRDMAHRDIPAEAGREVCRRSLQGIGLLHADPSGVRAVHLDLLEQLAQPAPGADGKHSAAAGSPIVEHLDDDKPSAFQQVLRFYESLDLATGVAGPAGQAGDQASVPRAAEGLDLLHKCLRDLQRMLAPTRPELARTLGARLAGSATALAARLGVKINIPAQWSTQALMDRVDAAGAELRDEAGLPPVGALPKVAPARQDAVIARKESPVPAPVRADGKASAGTLSHALRTLPRHEAKARQQLEPFALRMASAIEPVTRGELAGEIAGIAKELDASTLAQVGREMALRMGGEKLHPATVTRLLTDLVTPDGVEADAARALAVGVAQALGGSGLTDPLVRALLAPALATGAHALPPAKQEAIVRALAAVLGPKGRVPLLALVGASALAPEDRQRLRGAITPQDGRVAGAASVTTTQSKAVSRG